MKRILLNTGLITLTLLIGLTWFFRATPIAPYEIAYLGLAVLIWVLGWQFFGGRFVQPPVKQPGKLLAYLVISWVLVLLIGHFALIFIIGHQLIGMIGHIKICKKYGINWRTTQPEDKYRELMEKWGRGDFSPSAGSASERES